MPREGSRPPRPSDPAPNQAPATVIRSLLPSGTPGTEVPKMLPSRHIRSRGNGVAGCGVGFGGVGGGCGGWLIWWWVVVGVMFLKRSGAG